MESIGLKIFLPKREGSKKYAPRKVGFSL